MSINAMTKRAIEARMEASLIETDAGPPAPPTEDAFDKTLGLITAYIPTEVIGLYVAARGFIDNDPKHPLYLEWNTFWIILVSTPFLVWLIHAAKASNAELPPLRALLRLPVWQIASATAAFYIWGYALPGSPFGHNDGYSSAWAAVILLVATLFLGLLSRFFEGIILPLDRLFKRKS